jgi:GTP-binding protein
MTKIALLGKPNVGKSSLFNRIARKRDAITSEVSGTTRDVKKGEVLLNETPAVLIDTGGLDDSSTLFSSVKEKSLQAAEQADIILYMVDGKMLPDDEDKKLFFALQKLGKKIALVVNKIDNDRQQEEIGWEFTTFGTKDIFFLSVSHNRGTRKLINWLESQIPVEERVQQPEIVEDEDDFALEEVLAAEEAREAGESDEKPEEDNEIKIAIIGRVNVGKSSLLNALVGEERSVVSEVAGTTIDPVDESILYEDKLFTFVDTAGIRRRGKIEGIEKFALNRTQSMLENADIALLVLDASEDFTELDERIANLVEKFELGCIIVLNKWDAKKHDYETSLQMVRDRFKFLSYAPVITVSALSKKRVYRIRDLIKEVYAHYTFRIPTSQLNEILKRTNKKHQLPSDHGKVTKIYFGTQFDIKPPRIALIMNRPKSLHFSYKRYLINQLRNYFDFSGTPIVIEAKKKKSDEDFES